MNAVAAKAPSASKRVASTANNGFLRMRIDEELKEQAEATLGLMGLDMSDAVKVFLRRVVAERRMPFEIYAVSTPLELTRRAMMESRAIINNRTARYGSVEDFFNGLEKEEGGATEI